MKLLMLFSITLTLNSCVIIDQFFEPGSKLYKLANKKYESYSEAKKNNSKHKVLVAVIDSGVDYTHPGLRNNMHYNLKELKGKFNQVDEDRNTFKDDFLGYDFTGNDGLPFYALLTLNENETALERDIEVEGFHSAEHGTHVAGIVTGKDPHIGIIPFRVLPLSANKHTGLIYQAETEADDRRNALRSAKLLAKYIRDSIYMAKRQGARVANISLGESPFEYLSESELKRAYQGLRKYISGAATNMIITVAAGNEKTDISSGAKMMPCQLRVGNIVCVGSVDNKGNLSEWDEENGTNNGLQFVDLYAPGDDILSAYPVDHAKFNETKPSIRMSGTSMAAPYVANVAAKMLIAKPCLTAKQVISIIKKTAYKRIANIRLGNSTRDEYRYRVINREAALKSAKNTSCN